MGVRFLGYMGVYLMLQEKINISRVVLSVYISASIDECISHAPSSQHLVCQSCQQLLFEYLSDYTLKNRSLMLKPTHGIFLQIPSFQSIVFFFFKTYVSGHSFLT